MFHVRDTTNFLQDDFETRKCLSGPPIRRPRGLQRLKNYPGRASGAPRCTVRAALRRPGAPRGAAQARPCKPLESEHQSHRPAKSTWHRSADPAPPVQRLGLSPTTLSFSRLAALLPSLPPRRTRGIGGLTGLRPLPPTSKRIMSGGERPPQVSPITFRDEL